MYELTEKELYIVNCMKQNPVFHKDDIYCVFLYAYDFKLLNKLYDFLKANPEANLDAIGTFLGWYDNDKEEDGKIDG